jgi:hypothetical protein
LGHLQTENPCRAEPSSSSTRCHAHRYRSGWYLVDDQPKTMFAMGIHGQNLFIDRANRIVVAKLSSWKQRIDYVPLWATHRGFERLQKKLIRDSR